MVILNILLISLNRLLALEVHVQSLWKPPSLPLQSMYLFPHLVPIKGGIKSYAQC